MSKLSWAITALISALSLFTAAASAASFRYTTPTGFFLQEDPSINSSPPDYTKTSYGLLNRSYPTDPVFDHSLTKPLWSRFTHYLTTLNQDTTVNTTIYKLLYLARHGEAYHNVAQSYYGSKCWDCYWSQQSGNGTVTWLDAEMTPRGITQILASNAFWQDVAPTEKIPFPVSFYVSPMARTLATANLTFESLDVWTESKPFAPTVKESLRETINACTCAWRHPKKWISERFPGYKFENGFHEDDVLFTGNTIESASAQALRVTTFLDDIFLNDSSMVISVTTHGVNINPILGVIGHPNSRYNITTGQAIAVLVKAERLADDEPIAVGDPPTSAEVCGPCGPTVSR